MSSAQAVLFGAALIALSVWFTSGAPSASAMGGGPFQLMQHSNTTANVGVFRIDTSSGEVSYCYLPGTGNQAEVVCTKPTH